MNKVVAAGFLAGMLFGTGQTAVAATTLEGAVREALESHPDIRVQSNELQARAQEIEQARAGFRPRVDVTAAAGWDWNDNSSTRGAGYGSGRDLMRRELGVRLTQMLFDGYGTESEVARQEARHESTRHRLQGVGQNVALDAVKAYLDVQRHRELLRLSEENLAAHRQTERQIRLRREAGIGSAVDLDQVRGRRANAVASRLSDLVNLKDVETRYLRTVGRPAPLDLAPAPAVESRLPGSLDEAMRVALSEHPVLKSASADVKAALAQQRAAGQNDYPRFDLEVSSDWGEDQNGLKGTNRGLSAMVRMRYNLYAGGRDTARKAQTAHLVNEAKAVRNQTYREVVESLRLAWAAYQATRVQLDALVEYVRATTATREAYGKQFNIGKRTLVDLLNIENELFEARRSLVEARYDNLYAQYRIVAGMGRLLDLFDASVPEDAGPASEEETPFAQHVAGDLGADVFRTGQRGR